MSRRFQENIVALLLLGFFIAVLTMSLDYGPRARLVPVPIAVLGIVLVLFQIAWQNLRSADELNIDLLDVLTERDGTPAADDAADEETTDDPPPAAVEENGEAMRITYAVGMVVVFVAMILTLGPMPSIFIFTGVYFVVSGHYPPAKGFLIAAVFTIATYLVFVHALHLQLYNGYLEPAVEFLRRMWP